jgi:phosphatidylserine/phosphatidylglycerophosphate/cardiolipin synthase-like enzyme
VEVAVILLSLIFVQDKIFAQSSFQPLAVTKKDTTLKTGTKSVLNTTRAVPLIDVHTSDKGGMTQISPDSALDLLQSHKTLILTPTDVAQTFNSKDTTIIHFTGPTFTHQPEETSIEEQQVTISFSTLKPCNAIVYYGLSSYYTDSLVAGKIDSVHDFTISKLSPSTLYHYKVIAKDSEGVNSTGDLVFATASPASSTGTIRAYFSKQVDPSVAIWDTANVVDISQKFINRIDSSKFSIDIALYSLKGTVGQRVADALLNAKARGVKIRMIVENDNANTTPIASLKNNNVPLITDAFDSVNAGRGLMHNKFAIFDYRDASSSADDWIWTGSWNATDPGNYNDAQNAVEIQDRTLALAYTVEFNEMWGSDSDTPDQQNSRFGMRKRDNTPHRFNVKGIPIALYFSPSDQTALHIKEELDRATSSVNIAMLTLTRSDLAQELVTLKSSSVKVRVILDNNTDTGTQFPFLQTNGIDIRLKGTAITGLLHHKYAIIDADKASTESRVITGSYNWTNSAETVNSENTLIIFDRQIANEFLQEFKSRYIEAGGSDAITGISENKINQEISAFELKQNYPNPFNPSTTIEFRLLEDSYLDIDVYNILGQKIAKLIGGFLKAGAHQITFDARQLPSGIYFYTMRAGNRVYQRKMILLK